MASRARFLGIGLALVFLALVVWRVNLAEMASALGSANYWYVVPAASVTLIGYGLRTLRWRSLLSPTKRVPWGRLFPVLVIGFMVNNVLPARMGEVVRAYTLGQKEQVSKSLGLATIMLERLLDGLTLVIFAGLLALGFSLPGWSVEVAYIASALFLGVAAGLTLLLLREELAIGLLRVLLRPLPPRFAGWVQGLTDSFVLGLGVLRHRRVVLVVLALSVLVWLCEGLSYYLILLGFSLPLSPLATAQAAVFLTVFVNLGIMLPTSPGHVGTFHFFATLALAAFGLEPELGLSIAVVSHAMQYLMVTALGLVFLWHEQLSLPGWRRVQDLEGVGPTQVRSAK